MVRSPAAVVASGNDPDRSPASLPDAGFVVPADFPGTPSHAGGNWRPMRDLYDGPLSAWCL